MAQRHNGRQANATHLMVTFIAPELELTVKE